MTKPFCLINSITYLCTFSAWNGINTCNICKLNEKNYYILFRKKSTVFFAALSKVRALRSLLTCILWILLFSLLMCSLPSSTYSPVTSLSWSRNCWKPSTDESKKRKKWNISSATAISIKLLSDWNVILWCDKEVFTLLIEFWKDWDQTSTEVRRGQSDLKSSPKAFKYVVGDFDFTVVRSRVLCTFE